MSTIWEVAKAVRESTLPAPARHIVQTLAFLADAETGIVADRFTPSLSTLAKQTGLGRSTVAEQLGRLEAAGWILRIRPSVAEARSVKARTRYVLSVGKASLSTDLPAVEGGVVQELDQPAGPGDGLVQELDQTNRAGDWSRSGTSPGAGPELVQELDSTSPGAGHVTTKNTPKDYQSEAHAHAHARTRARDDPPTDPPTAPLPDNFAVTEQMRDWATRKVPDLDIDWHTEIFLNHWKSTGDEKANWEAAWRTWMLRDSQSPNSKKANTPSSRHTYKNPKTKADYGKGWFHDES